MAVATWRLLAFGAFLCSASSPVLAQVVIGGSSQPSVVVDWGVLDTLGRQPTLPDMLQGRIPPADVPVATMRPRANAATSTGAPAVQFQPYKPPRAKTVAKAKPSHPKGAVVAASAKVADAVAPAKPAAQVAKTETAKAEAPAVEAPVLPGPKVSLPEAPKPAPAASVAPPAKADVASPVAAAPPAEVETPKVATQAPVPVVPPIPAPTAVAEASKPAVSAPVPAPAPATAPTPAVVVPPSAFTPPPAPVPPPAAAPTQVAAVPAAAAPAVVPSSQGDTLSVVFSGADSTTLPSSALPELDRLVKRLRKDDNLALQLLAFADGDDANASKARRTSLSRALEVRRYLMEQGLRSTRIEVRALGNKLDGGGPADRVDAVLVTR